VKRNHCRDDAYVIVLMSLRRRDRHSVRACKIGLGEGLLAAAPALGSRDLVIDIGGVNVPRSSVVALVGAGTLSRRIGVSPGPKCHDAEGLGVVWAAQPLAAQKARSASRPGCDVALQMPDGVVWSERVEAHSHDQRVRSGCCAACFEDFGGHNYPSDCSVVMAPAWSWPDGVPIPDLRDRAIDRERETLAG
jgi:hypothetical protein